MKTINLLLFLVLIAFTSCSTTDVAEEEELFVSTAAKTMTSSEEEMMNIVNDHRVSMGLNALEFSADTYKYATEHNQYMISKGKLSHDNFSSRASKLAGETNAVFVGENVAKDFPTNMQAFNGWYESSGHRSTMEGDFTHTAVSIIVSSEGKPYFTQIFIKK